MALELWIALLLVTALLAGVVGYNLARRGAPKRSDLDALQRELEAAERRAEEVQDNVTDHFEQSAMLFGRLARDYRAFLEHFSESARELGISEVKARELLERADRPLLGHSQEVIDAEAAAREEAAPAQATEAHASAADVPEADVPEPGEEATPATADDTTVSPEPAATEALEPRSEATDAAAATGVQAEPAEEDEKPQASAPGGASKDPEPPLISDVVGGKQTSEAVDKPAPGSKAAGATSDTDDTAEGDGAEQEKAASARVVDVEVDALGLPVEEPQGDARVKDSRSAR